MPSLRQENEIGGLPRFIAHRIVTLCPISTLSRGFMGSICGAVALENSTNPENDTKSTVHTNEPSSIMDTVARLCVAYEYSAILTRRELWMLRFADTGGSPSGDSMLTPGSSSLRARIQTSDPVVESSFHQDSVHCVIFAEGHPTPGQNFSKTSNYHHVYFHR